MVLGGGLVLWSAAQMLTGLVRTLPTFLFLRVLLGTGEAPFILQGFVQCANGSASPHADAPLL